MPRPHRLELVCQQLLALGLVAAVAAPAASTVAMDIVPAPGAGTVAGAAPAPVPAPAPEASGASPVATAPVRPHVTDVPLTGVSDRGVDALPDAAPARSAGPAARLVAATGDPETDDLAVLSAPQTASGLATVGVTWSPRADVADDAMTIWLRTETDGTWSAWQRMPFHEEEGPDSGTGEAGDERPGTDPVYVGAVDDVQVKADTASGRAPAGMTLSVVDPGASRAAAPEQPAIDTGDLDLTAAEGPLQPGADPNPELPAATGSSAALASSVTAKPQIFSRAQWGADEHMRDKSSLHYGEVHAGFVHHTVNANGYTRGQVPAILRGIYAYHTQSRGWSDIGYNFLVDRFGRIWEGRYGGVARPVVGAHTLGYNDDAFAMSAIGNYDVARPPAAVVDAYARLFAWKLSLHGVSATATHQWVTKRYLPAINGHRDVGQTACPGRYLYAKIPEIRQLAAHYQHSFASRRRTTDLSGSAWPDLVVRDSATKKVYQLRTGGQLTFPAAGVARSGLAGTDLLAAVGDVTGDGIADLLARTRATGSTAVLPGDGKGHYGDAVKPTTQFAHADLLAGVGDWDQDGHADVVARDARTDRLTVYYGNGRGRFGSEQRRLAGDWGSAVAITGAGDLDGDGRPDIVAQTSDGRLVLYPGRGGAVGSARTLVSDVTASSLLGGGWDLTRDGHPDLLMRRADTGAVWIYPGASHGTLSHRLAPIAGLTTYSRVLSVGQVSGSAAPDLLAVGGKGRARVFASSGRNVEKLVATGTTFPRATQVLNVGDWDGDGAGDVVTRSRSGALYLYRGDGSGHFQDGVKMGTGFESVSMLAAVGDMTGDGYPDLMGQPAGGSMRIYPGNHRTGFATSYVAHSAVPGTLQLGLGLWDRDGAPDSLIRRSDGSLVLYPGNGPGGLTGGTKLDSLSSAYDWVLSPGDVDGDGRPDLLVRDKAGANLWLLPGTSSGFGPRQLVTSGLDRFDLAG